MKMMQIMADERHIREMREAGGRVLVLAIPMAMLADHERQAKINHSQTLDRLNERGGLSACEALAIMEDRSWKQMPIKSAHEQLAGRLAGWAMMRSD